jgi:hypothetical protein
MVSKPLILGVLALLALRGSSKAQAAKGFNYALGGFPTVSYQGGGAVITFPIVIQNPSAESFSIRAANVAAFVNSQFIGNVEPISAFNIPSMGSVNVPLRVTVYLSNAALSLIETLASGVKNGVVVKLSGGVDANALTVPLELSKTF